MCFLQNRNLPGVIEFMLHDPMQHVIEVVSLAGNAVTQAGLGKSGDGSYKSIVRVFCLSYGFAPPPFRRNGHGRKIRQTSGLAFFSA